MGAAPPVVTILPLSNGATFSSIEFDACDGSLIGVINNYPASMTISRYDLSAQTFTTIADYPSIYLMGFETAFDPTLRQYYLPLFPDLYVYNVDNGSIMNQISIMPPPGESFGHIVAHCQDGSIYGTSANLNEFVKYLSIIDMESGQVDHISDTAIDQGVIKPGGGGSCIDRNNERFYWSGAGGLIVGASLETGESVPTTVSHPGEFYFLECMSPCDCLPSSLPVIQEEGIEIGVTENNMLVVQNFGDHGEMNLSILDHLGRSVANSKVDRVSGSVQLPELGAGSYLWILEAEDELIGTGRFVTLR